MTNSSKINSQEDVLAWDLFLNGSEKRNKLVPKVSTLDNRLIFETKNLFVVAGLGCFVPGYYLIITKSPYTSFAQLDENEFKLAGVLILFNNLLQSLFKSQILTLGLVMIGIFLMFFVFF